MCSTTSMRIGGGAAGVVATGARSRCGGTATVPPARAGRCAMSSLRPSIAAIRRNGVPAGSGPSTRVTDVGNLVADWRLGAVDQVGEQHVMAGHAGWHRPVELVDHLEQDQVLPHVHSGRGAGGNHPGLGRGVHAERLEPPCRADLGAHVLGEDLAGVGDDSRRDVQPSDELLLRDERDEARVSGEDLRLVGVELPRLRGRTEPLHPCLMHTGSR
jgi:hypothetical protein